MPGPRTTYSARTADLHVQYSDEHPWCGIDVFLPAADKEIVAVWGWNRGGGNVSEPSIWDRWGYDPDAAVGESPDIIEDLLEAGIAYVRVEYPNGPQPIYTSRHHPTVRMPHNWMFTQRAFQFMQTHALDGAMTGSRSRAFPIDYRGYFFGGPSAGALNAGMVAFSPTGHIPYDSLFRRNFGYFAVTEPGRIRGAWMDDLPAEFMLYGPGISANTLPFFGDSGRIQGDSLNTPGIVQATRLETLRREDRRDIGLLKLAELRAAENLHVSCVINNSVNLMEASYFGSGLTLNVNSYTGDWTGAATVSVTADTTKTATVKKIVQTSPTSIRVFAEPATGTYARHWTGALTLGGASLAAYQVYANDDRKAFVSRQASQTLCEAANYGPFADLITPHPVVSGGLLATERERLFALANDENVVNHDRYYLGSDYPAEISGDEVARAYVSNFDKTGAILDWMGDLGVNL